jgi:hypothetical protein
VPSGCFAARVPFGASALRDEAQAAVLGSWVVIIWTGLRQRVR